MVGGTSFQPMPKLIGKNALTSRMLCKKHNSDLSPLDTVGRDVLDAIQSAQKELQKQDPRQWTRAVSGDLFERWLLKVVFGMWFSGVFARDGKKILGRPPKQWGRILVGEEPFPDRWGMYLSPPAGMFYTAHQQFAVASLSRTSDDQIIGARIELATIPFFVLLGRPDNPEAFGIKHSGGLKFRQVDIQKQLQFAWVGGEAGKVTEFLRIGEGPPA